MFGSAGVEPSQMKGKAMIGASSIRVANSEHRRAAGGATARAGRWLTSWLLGGLLAAVCLLVTNTTRRRRNAGTGRSRYVVDTTGSISTADRERLVGMARQINQSTGAQLFTVVVDHTDPEPIENFAQRSLPPGSRVARAPTMDWCWCWRRTTSSAEDGWIGYGLEGAIPDATARRILGDQVRRRWIKGSAAAAATVAATAIQMTLTAAGVTPDRSGRKRPKCHRWRSSSSRLPFIYFIPHVYRHRRVQ